MSRIFCICLSIWNWNWIHLPGLVEHPISFMLNALNCILANISIVLSGVLLHCLCHHQCLRQNVHAPFLGWNSSSFCTSSTSGPATWTTSGAEGERGNPSSLRCWYFRLPGALSESSCRPKSQRETACIRWGMFDGPYALNKPFVNVCHVL